MHAPRPPPQWRLSRKLHWSVPAVLVPGEPAPVHLDSSISEGSEYLDKVGTEEITGKVGLFFGNYAKDLHSGEAFYGPRYLNGCHQYKFIRCGSRGRGPARPSDDFALKLPDLVLPLFNSTNRAAGTPI